MFNNNLNLSYIYVEQSRSERKKLSFSTLILKDFVFNIVYGRQKKDSTQFSAVRLDSLEILDWNVLINNYKSIPFCIVEKSAHRFTRSNEKLNCALCRIADYHTTYKCEYCGYFVCSKCEDEVSAKKHCMSGSTNSENYCLIFEGAADDEQQEEDEEVNFVVKRGVSQVMKNTSSNLVRQAAIRMRPTPNNNPNSHLFDLNDFQRFNPHEMHIKTKCAIVSNSDINFGASYTQIGRGSYSKVYKVLLRNKTCAAAKLVRVQVNNERQITPQYVFNKFFKEASLLSMLNHKNIIKYYGLMLDPCLGIITEFCNGPNLQQFIYEGGNSLADRLPILLFHQFAKDIASGMRYIHHNMGLIHRDLKPSNILLNKVDGERFSLKIADFGLAIDRLNANYAHSYYGSPNYVAPEIVNRAGFGNDRYTEYSDVYAYGITLYELVCESRPYSVDSFNDLREILASENSDEAIRLDALERFQRSISDKLHENMRPDLSPVYQLIICSCLQVTNREHRPRFRQILEDLKSQLERQNQTQNSNNQSFYSFTTNNTCNSHRSSTIPFQLSQSAATNPNITQNSTLNSSKTSTRTRNETPNANISGNVNYNVNGIVLFPESATSIYSTSTSSTRTIPRLNNRINPASTSEDTARGLAKLNLRDFIPLNDHQSNNYNNIHVNNRLQTQSTSFQTIGEQNFNSSISSSSTSSSTSSFTSNPSTLRQTPPPVPIITDLSESRSRRRARSQDTQPYTGGAQIRQRSVASRCLSNFRCELGCFFDCLPRNGRKQTQQKRRQQTKSKCC